MHAVINYAAVALAFQPCSAGERSIFELQTSQTNGGSARPPTVVQHKEEKVAARRRRMQNAPVVKKSFFCAKWEQSASSSASGYFLGEHYQVESRESKWQWSFSLNHPLVAAADCGSGKAPEITYALHTQWNLSSSMEATDLFAYNASSFGTVLDQQKHFDATNKCSRSVTGGRYDPYHACSPTSSQTDACAAKGWSGNYSARCSTKNPRLCEIGDLSGRMGMAALLHGGMISLAPVVDTAPAPARSADAAVPPHGFSSVVIHAKCPGNRGKEWILCAMLRDIDKAEDCIGTVSAPLSHLIYARKSSQNTLPKKKKKSYRG